MLSVEGRGEGRGEANSNNSIQLLLNVLVQQGEVFRLRKSTSIGKTCDFCSFTFNILVITVSAPYFVKHFVSMKKI